MRKTLFFQKKIKLFNVQFMLLHVSAQMKDIFIVFVDFPVRLNVMKKLAGMENNIKQATAHKPTEMFFKFTVVLCPGGTVRLRVTFLAIASNLKLANINGGKNNATKIAKNTAREIAVPVLEIIYTTVVVISNIARRVSSLRLVTDVRWKNG